MHAQSRKIGKPNNLLFLRSNIWPKQDSQDQSEGGDH